MRNYLVVDRAADFHLLKGNIEANTKVIVISADARTGIPKDWPIERTIHLSELITSEKLTKAVTYRVSQIFPQIAKLDNCPFYKVKQILDAVTEKEIIVETLSKLDGQKYYVNARKQWFSVDGDNSEDLRIASEFMDLMPGFIQGATTHQPATMAFVKNLTRNILLVAQATKRRLSGEAPSCLSVWLGNPGYGSYRDFAKVPHATIDRASLTLSALLTFKLKSAFRLLTYEFPILTDRHRDMERHLAIDIVSKIMARSNKIHSAVEEVLASIDTPEVFFTVNYSRLADIAIVRALRKRQVKIFSMQHACVGHDSWTASQYHDLWESDFKIVANSFVGEELNELEVKKHDASNYIAASLPMYRRERPPVNWDGKSIIYVLTGFTRCNTMYDNRRINDALYLDQVVSDLSILAKSFSIQIKDHPYDKRQYANSIAKWLKIQTGAPIFKSGGELFDDRSLLIIDSPSTVLADAVICGRPALVLNRTATMRCKFSQIDNMGEVFWPSMEKAVGYLNKTSSEDIVNAQQSFGTAFYNAYCHPSDNVTIAEAVIKHINKHA